MTLKGGGFLADIRNLMPAKGWITRYACQKNRSCQHYGGHGSPPPVRQSWQAWTHANANCDNPCHARAWP